MTFIKTRIKYKSPKNTGCIQLGTVQSSMQLQWFIKSLTEHREKLPTIDIQYWRKIILDLAKTAQNAQRTGHFSPSKDTTTKIMGRNVDHLLFIAMGWWTNVFMVFGVDGDAKNGVWYTSMLEEKPISFNNRVSNVVPSCVMWNIWRERNRRMFKGH